MAIRLSAVDGIDMGNKPISNASQIDSSSINEDGTSVLVEGDVYTKAEIDSTVATTSAKGMVELATTTEARTGTDSTRAVTPEGLHYAFNKTGTAPMYACRAWVNFNGTGTVAIRASGNVSSITDNGVGNYTVNFTTAMPDLNYGMSWSKTYTTNYNAPGTAGNDIILGAKTISSQRIYVGGVSSGTNVIWASGDVVEVNLSFYR